jgi:hypothetical protein
MKMTFKSGIIGAVALCLATVVHTSGQPIRLSTAALGDPIPRDQLPKFGTYWIAQGPNGWPLPPLPFPPLDLPEAPIYLLADGQFLVDSGIASILSIRTPH